MRKHYFNQNYFSEITTEEQAYWLGFISADGSVGNDYSITIGLAKKDEKHIQKFAEAIDYKNKLTEKLANGKYPTTYIQLYSKTMFSDLGNKGIFPRKTFTAKPWVGTENLMKHYWRGVFDGDGSINRSIKKRKNVEDYSQWRVNLVGTLEIVQGFNDFVFNNTEAPYNSGKISPHSSVYSITYSGIRPSQKVLNLLYSNCSLFLDRKYLLFQQVVKLKLQEKVISGLTLEVLEPLKEKLGNWESVAKELGISRNGLYKHLRRNNVKLREMKHWTRTKM